MRNLVPLTKIILTLGTAVWAIVLQKPESLLLLCLFEILILLVSGELFRSIKALVMLTVFAAFLGLIEKIGGGSNVESVVEQVIGLILDCAHKITASHLAGIHGLKQKMPEFLCGCEITGKKLGLIGVGHIGSRVGRRLQAGFNMDVTAWSPHLTDDACRELGFHRAAGPEEIYQTCDVISVSVPLTEATRHMIGAKELRLFKPGSILINTSRGGIVDEDALCQALQENELFGAGFDTFLQEPLPADHVLFTCFNFVATPHNAANTKEAMIRMGTQAVDIIRNVEKE
jgi:D-3-phosphoglycerate dehydrogenase